MKISYWILTRFDLSNYSFKIEYGRHYCYLNYYLSAIFPFRLGDDPMLLKHCYFFELFNYQYHRQTPKFPLDSQNSSNYSLIPIIFYSHLISRLGNSLMLNSVLYGYWMFSSMFNF